MVQCFDCGYPAAIGYPGDLPDGLTGAVMREDLASSSFLAVIVLSLIIACAGFLALGI
jgi:hypothetical protein